MPNYVHFHRKTNQEQVVPQVIDTEPFGWTEDAGSNAPSCKFEEISEDETDLIEFLKEKIKEAETKLQSKKDWTAATWEGARISAFKEILEKVQKDLTSAGL